MKQKQLVDNIIKSINDHPEKWKSEGFYFKNGDINNIEIWIANGRSGLKIKLPTYIQLNWSNRRKLWKAILNHKNNEINSAL